MQLLPQPQDSNSAAKFKLYGFPDEALVTMALQDFYRTSAETPRDFLIYNMFEELIFTGTMAADAQVLKLESKNRIEEKAVYKKED